LPHLTVQEQDWLFLKNQLKDLRTWMRVILLYLHFESTTKPLSTKNLPLVSKIVYPVPGIPK
jgi:hypothetical protein